MIQQFHFGYSIPKLLKARTRNRHFKSMLIVALFAIAKRWKQPKSPWTEEWITNVVSTLN